MFLSIPGADADLIVEVNADEVRLGRIWVEPEGDDVDILSPLRDHLGPEGAPSYLRTRYLNLRPKGAQSAIRVNFAAWYDKEEQALATTDSIFLVGNNGKTISKA